MKNKVKSALDQTGKIVIKAAKVVIPIFVYGTYAYLTQGIRRCENSNAYRYPHYTVDSSYEKAANAICNSGMYSNDKAEAINSLRENETEEYYEAVISITKSSMYSKDKVKAIRGLAK